MNADAVREAYEAVRAEAGAGVTVVAATKYVAAEDMGVLVERGHTRRRREPGPGPAAQARRSFADSFRWHFIGALQSNKARVVNEICELVHAVDTDSAARRLTVPWLLEVNLAGEASKSGVAETRDRLYMRALPAALRADDDAAVRRRSRGQPTDVPPPRRARARPRPRAALDGHLQDWRVAVEEGATLIRVGSTLGPDSTGGLVVADPERLRVAAPSYFAQAGYEMDGTFAPRPGAARFDPNWWAASSLVGLLAALDGRPAWGFDHAAAVAERCRELLAARVEVVSPAERSTLVAFRGPGETAELVESLHREGVHVRDIPGTGLIRVSCGWWTSDGDLERLLAALPA